MRKRIVLNGTGHAHGQIKRQMDRKKEREHVQVSANTDSSIYKTIIVLEEKLFALILL